jgi:hypothetical protein
MPRNAAYLPVQPLVNRRSDERSDLRFEATRLRSPIIEGDGALAC